jgi:tetratricopeptide (TPR) repeat protein
VKTDFHYLLMHDFLFHAIKTYFIMKNIIAFILSIVLIISISSCSKKIISQETTDSKGNKNLLGKSDKKNLEKEPYNIWFNKNYNDYVVDTLTAEQLKPNLINKHFTIFMGTWCGDSRREVPRMYKILEYCGVPTAHINLIMLSNTDSMYKQSPQHEERGINIHRVPDLIVFNNKTEMGRIVESAVVSLEKDLLSITNNEGYVPNYKAVSFLITIFSEKKMDEINNHINDYANAVKLLAKNSSELNTYGYVLMAAKEMDKAGFIFKCNTILYPAEANVFDSMGEYYFKAGNKILAKENYTKTLQLDPTNEDAKKMLAQLGN